MNCLDENAQGKRPGLWAWLGALLLMTAMLGVYYPALHGGFVWDDESWTTSIEPLLRDASGLIRMWTTPTALQQYFPLTGTTFWIDHHLWGAWTLPYHVENLLLHALSALLFWRLLARIDVPGAWLAASLFALHPVMVESVAWITERKNVLSMVWFLAALLAYGRFTSFWRDDADVARWRQYWLAHILFLAALLAKATAFAFPAVVLLICWWRRGRITWRGDVAPTLPFFVISISYGLLISWIEVRHVGADGSEWPVMPLERPIIAGRAIWFYLGKLLHPADMHPIYPRWEINAHDAVQWLAPVLVVLALGILWLLRGKFGRGPLMAALFFVGTLFPVLGFLNVYGMNYSFVADRWVYLSSLGVFASIAALVAGLARLVRRAWVTPFFAALVLPLLAFLTWQKAAQYKDAETLMRAALAGNPKCWVACYNLANDMKAAGRSEEALQLYQRAVDIWPGYAKAHANYGSTLLGMGRADKAAAHLSMAVKLMPGLHAAHHSLGLFWLQKGNGDEAISCFEKAVEFMPELHAAHQNLGVLLFRKGDVEGAIAHYQKVVELQPNEPRACRDLAVVLLRAGRVGEVVSQLERVIQLDDNDTGSLNNLAGILATSTDDAIRDGPRAVALALRAEQLSGGGSASILYTLAASYAEAGRFPEALSTAQRALERALAADDFKLAASLREAQKLYNDRRPLRDSSLGSHR